MTSGFDESVVRYEAFLAKNGFSPKVVWVTPEDVLASSEPEVYVRVPVPAGNDQQARNLFDLGMAQGLGVLFETLCESNDQTFAFVRVPRDEMEAE